MNRLKGCYRLSVLGMLCLVSAAAAKSYAVPGTVTVDILKRQYQSLGTLIKSAKGRQVLTISDQKIKVAKLRAYRKDLQATILLAESENKVVVTKGAVAPWARLWQRGRVPYTFNANVSANQKSAFRAACDAWEAVANLHFVLRTDEADYLEIKNSNSNSSYIGVQGGAQPVDIYNWDYRFIICHELAHAVGYVHEQQREDRDNYVTINRENIIQYYLSNFEIVPGALNMGPYDPESIMHYPANAFSSNGNPTIVVKPGVPYTGVIGQRDHFSEADKIGMAKLYGQPPMATAHQH